MKEITDYVPGDRVVIVPPSPYWSKDNLFGTVFRITRFYVVVRMDRGSKLLSLTPAGIARKVQS